ncbi:hypothetical protein D9M73_288700 [compost metagenome]
MPSAVLRCEVSSMAAKLLSISLAEPRVSLALASSDSVLYFGLATYMGSGSWVLAMMKAEGFR